MKWIRIITIMTMLGYSIAQLTLAIKTNANLEENIAILQDTISNWKNGAIIDIQVAANSACSPGYEPAYNYTWYGTNDGCDCRGVSDSSFAALGLHTSTCNSTETYKGCVTINSQGPYKLSTWGVIGNISYGFCIKRSSESWATIGPTQGTTCPSGKLKCGKSQDNFFCTSETQCPITDIKVTNTPCATCVQFDDLRYINITRGGDNLPLSEFRLNEYGMCYEVNQKTFTSGRSLFKLLMDSLNNCNGEGTPLWNKFDSWKESRLYIMNGLNRSINYLIPFGYYSGGTSGADYNWFIFNRGYVPWNLNCRGVMSEIITKSTKLDDVKTSHKTMLIVTILSTIVVGVILSLMEVLNLLGVDLPCIQGKEEEERHKLIKIKTRCSIAAKLILLPFQVWAIIVLTKLKGLIQYAADNTCSSPLMNNLIDRASDSLQKAFISDIVAIIVLIVFLLITLYQSHHEKKKIAAEKNKVAVQPTLDPNDTQGDLNDTSMNHSSIMALQPNNQQAKPQNLNRVQFANQPKMQLQFQQQPGLQPQQQFQTQQQFQPQPIQNPGNYQPGFQQQPMGYPQTIGYQQQPQQFQQQGYQQPGFQPQGFQTQPQMQPQPQPQGQQIVINLGGLSQPQNPRLW